MRVPFTPHPHQPWSLVFMTAILTEYIAVVLICVSLISDVEHFSQAPVGYLVVFFGENVYSAPLSIFLFKLWGFCYWVAWILFILAISPLFDTWFTNIFSLSVSCLFILFPWLLQLLSLTWSLLLSFASVAFGVMFKTSLPRPVLSFSPVFF